MLRLAIVSSFLASSYAELTLSALMPSSPEPELSLAYPPSSGDKSVVPLGSNTTVLLSFRPSAGQKLGKTECDINPSRSLSLPLNTWEDITVCTNAQGSQIQTVIRNTGGSSGANNFALYHGMSAAQCPSSGTFDPSLFTWPAANFYGPGTATSFVRTSTCTSNAFCCAVVVCDNVVFDCTNMAASVTFIEPSTGACGGSNRGLSRISTGSLSRAIGCVLSGTPASGTTQDFSVSNPNGHELTVWLTDGTGVLGCGLPATNPTGSFSYNYYQRVVATRGTSISFSGVQCASSTCCAIILCTDNNDLNLGCYGISYSQAIKQPSGASGLAVGVIIAIVIVSLTVPCAIAAFVRRRYYQPQTTFVQSSIVMNPVSLPQQPAPFPISYPDQFSPLHQPAFAGPQVYPNPTPAFNPTPYPGEQAMQQYPPAPGFNPYVQQQQQPNQPRGWA